MLITDPNFFNTTHKFSNCKLITQKYLQYSLHMYLYGFLFSWFTRIYMEALYIDIILTSNTSTPKVVAETEKEHKDIKSGALFNKP